MIHKLPLLYVMMLLNQPEPPPVVYTEPYKCQFLPPGEWDACEAPESWNDFCFSFTHYWPFDDDGNLRAGNGQTDSDPTRTAVGIEITSPEQDGSWVALPLPLISNGYHSVICIYGDGCFPGWDTFGHPTYQAGGFWHSYYDAKVIGVDVFTETVVHYLSCDPNYAHINIYTTEGELTNEH